MSILGVNKVLSVIQPMVGLLLLAVSIRLATRTGDPAVRIVGGWGAFWLLSACWNILIERMYLRSGIPPTDVVQLISGILIVGGRLGLFGIAMYALGRLWKQYGQGNVQK